MNYSVLCLTILHIFDDESVNSTFRYKKKPQNRNGGTKMADQKSNLNITLGEIRYLGIPEITDY